MSESSDVDVRYGTTDRGELTPILASISKQLGHEAHRPNRAQSYLPRVLAGGRVGEWASKEGARRLTGLGDIRDTQRKSEEAV